MKLYDYLPVRFLTVITGVILFCASAYSASLVDYYREVLLSYPQHTATEHQQCNQIDVTKSPINNKSLNPMCNVCLGDSDGATAQNIYSNLPSSTLDSNAAETIRKSVCILSVAQESNKAIYADWNLLCSTRGGTAVELVENVIFTCDFTQ